MLWLSLFIVNEGFPTSNFSRSLSSNINEGVKALYFLNEKRWEQKSFGIDNLAKVSRYIPTFTSLLNPSECTNLLVLQINGKF